MKPGLKFKELSLKINTGILLPYSNLCATSIGLNSNLAILVLIDIDHGPGAFQIAS